MKPLSRFMDTATREYTAPFFSTTNSWLVGARKSGTASAPSMPLRFSSSTATPRSTAARIRPARAPFLLFLS